MRTLDTWVYVFTSSCNFCSLGPVDPETVEKVEVKITDQEKERQLRVAARPSLDEILNLHDFEVSSGRHCCSLVNLRHHSGYCKTSHGRKSMGLLLFRRR